MKVILFFMILIFLIISCNDESVEESNVFYGMWINNKSYNDTNIKCELYFALDNSDSNLINQGIKPTKIKENIWLNYNFNVTTDSIFYVYPIQGDYIISNDTIQFVVTSRKIPGIEYLYNGECALDTVNYRFNYNNNKLKISKLEESCDMDYIILGDWVKYD